MARSKTDPRWIRQCEICGNDFQQMQPGTRTCGVKCRARLPHNTGGARAKAGLPERECPGCGKTFQPVRENQRTCSRKCGDVLPDRRAGQRERDSRPERRERQNEAKRLSDVPDYHRPSFRKNPAKGIAARDCAVCGTNFRPMRAVQVTCSRACYLRLPANKARAKDLRGKPDNRDRIRARNRRANLLAFHGMTVAEYDAKLAEQDGKCKVCGRQPRPSEKPSPSSVLHVDHDHVTGENRDLLCTTCNTGIGMFGDDPGWLRAAAEYIERHRSAVADQSSA